MRDLVPEQPRVRQIEFIDDRMVVELEDGRTIGVPIAWFSRLRDATSAQRINWRPIGGGIGIHWPDLDEDLSVAGLLSRDDAKPSKERQSAESEPEAADSDSGDDGPSIINGSGKSIEAP